MGWDGMGWDGMGWDSYSKHFSITIILANLHGRYIDMSRTSHISLKDKMKQHFSTKWPTSLASRTTHRGWSLNRGLLIMVFTVQWKTYLWLG